MMHHVQSIASSYPEWIRTFAWFGMLFLLMPGIIVILVGALNRHEPRPRRVMAIGAATFLTGVALIVLLFGWLS